jgi:hypothetical protein
MVLDFFLGGEVTCLGLNLSHGVGSFVRVFSLWYYHISRIDAIVEHVNLLSFENCSLVASLGETYRS